MSFLLHDLRHSIRLLAKTPGFSLTAVLVLALGIAANTAVFSLVNVLLVKPLAGSERPGQVVGIYSHDRTRPDSYRGFSYRGFSYPSYADVRDGADVFSHVAGFTMAFVGLNEGDGNATRRTFAGIVTGNYFATLGVGLAAGRTFTEEEERPGAAVPVAIVSHAHWASRGAEAAGLGKTIRINARPFTVVGIAPRGFNGTSALVAPEVWVPTGMNERLANDFMTAESGSALADRRSQALMLVGRLRPGVTEDAAAPVLNALSSRLEKTYPAENRNQQLTIHRLSRNSISTSPQDDDELRTPFVILMGMAGIVLIIACLNLANMMLARGTARRKEVAMRLALGAGRSHIVRQLLTEGGVLALAGGAGGLLLGYWGVHLLVSSLVALFPVPLALDARPDVRVLVATLLFCALSTILFGLGPAWRLARIQVVQQIKEQGSDERGGGRSRRLGARNLLVGAQIALSLGLLTAAGLFMRGAVKAGETDPGYRLDGQLVASIDVGLAAFDEPRGRETYRRALDRLRSMPGVRAASFSSVVAFGDFSEGKTVQKGGTPPGTGKDGRPVGQGATYYVVGADYFKTLGVRVLAGREFTTAEEQGSGAPPVAIIDEPLARALFPDSDPVGQYVQFARGDDVAPPAGSDVSAAGPGQPGPQVMEVVGVVAGLRHELFDKSPVAHVYVPSGRQYRTGMHLHVALAPGGAGAEAAMLQAVRRELRAVDEQLPILTLRTMEQHRDASILYWIVTAGARIFTLFGATAVFLAVVGLYAVKAYVVARRTREFGIRMALGSTPGNLLWLVLKEGLALTAAGLAAGFLIAFAIGQVVGSLLYEVNAFDPLVFAAAPLLLAAVSLVACYLPARRATRVTPIVALRTE